MMDEGVHFIGLRIRLCLVLEIGLGEVESFSVSCAIEIDCTIILPPWTYCSSYALWGKWMILVYLGRYLSMVHGRNM